MKNNNEKISLCESIIVNFKRSIKYSVPKISMYSMH